MVFLKMLTLRQCCAILLSLSYASSRKRKTALVRLFAGFREG